MRPTTIRLFEASVIASQLIRIVNIVVHAGAMAAALEIERNQLLIGPFANALVAIGLALAVSRGRFSIARWFLAAVIALDLIGLGGIPAVATMIGVPFAIFSVIAILLMLAAGVLMFLPASSEWLKQRA
ncbi:hypothetical protein [Novosphingobium taihuense]|uniref:Uncharacterized protein n=1 Tax=Novosphingobium taihuense TaxID=260085 RepID=A0A7W7AEM4_9SPHN|nr:hypothetical protein [Novosphingobium taihuense]MBB4614712.1 hypothetical protein [Novosphingobium taihuense]TWH86046.1 hypothetical protein IQ25_01493 [Novosphingobium taihuense]